VLKNEIVPIRLFFYKKTTQNIPRKKLKNGGHTEVSKQQLNTPPQYPDMNPIKHLWNEIGRRLNNIIKFKTKTN